MIMFKKVYIILLSFIILSCNDQEGNDLASADERIESAISDLRDKLTAPSNGWVLNYRPNNGGGSYYMLLDFEEDEVRIQSDVAYDSGYLYDQTIPYKLDAQSQLVLTFETYAVFHYLFEEEQSTFGAEFEFFFVEDSNGDLVFSSKTDTTFPFTTISLSPALAGASDFFAYEQVDNMQLFELYNQPFGTEIVQQVYIASDNVSIFWTIDLLQRTIALDAAAVGETGDEIDLNNMIADLNGNFGFSYGSSSIIFEETIDFTLNGKQYSFTEIQLDELSNSGMNYCSSSAETSPIYLGEINGVGSCELRHTLYQSSGKNFIKQAEIPYSVNVFFVGDSTGVSLTDEDEVIGINYPEATGFVFNYGLIDEDNVLPEYAIGITYQDDDGLFQTDYRGFEPADLVGNVLQITLNEDFYYTKDSPMSDDEARIRNVTDELIGLGTEELYISEWADIGDDIVVYRLFNPCNGNEFALVEP